MPQSSPKQPPTQQVEKIREILVGRQMRTVEQRITQLEANLHPMPTNGENPQVTSLMAAHKDQVLELRALRQHLDKERQAQNDQIRRLADQIQTIARERRGVAEDAKRSVDAAWFQQWQGKLQTHLQQREEHLVNSLRSELEELRGWVRNEVASSSRSETEGLRSALKQFAQAAQAVSDHLPSD